MTFSQPTGGIPARPSPLTIGGAIVFGSNLSRLSIQTEARHCDTCWHSIAWSLGASKRWSIGLRSATTVTSDSDWRNDFRRALTGVQGDSCATSVYLCLEVNCKKLRSKGRDNRNGWRKHSGAMQIQWSFNYLIECDPLRLVVVFPPGNVFTQSLVVDGGRLKAELRTLNIERTTWMARVVCCDFKDRIQGLADIFLFEKELFRLGPSVDAIGTGKKKLDVRS